uniref:Ovule protein n=1 Tax=Gongylonema pulchrum TaxID=637853 RepID=A0A183D684_9BILA
LADYFRSGKMNPTIWTTERASGKHQHELARPTIVVPIREMIEHAVPSSVLNTLSQFSEPRTEKTVPFASKTFDSIYIHSIDEEFIVCFLCFSARFCCRQLLIAVNVIEGQPNQFRPDLS